ncbi:MAG: hypothetical protein Q9M36_16070 [Sulfurovum sp.]|nr:hypothetical protein [Sulfurovum sp.]
MKLLEDKLEELDIYFAPKKESEKWVLILGVAGVIAYLGYAFLLPYTEELYEQSERDKKRVEKKISENNTYLSGITSSGDRDYYVKQYDKDIIVKKNKIVNIKDKINFIDSNLEKLSDMLFNQKSWSIFLNSITVKAASYNIDLAYIDNKYSDNNGSFGHVLEIGIGAKGNFKNIITFMNELEQNILVTDIFETRFVLDNNSSDIIA